MLGTFASTWNDCFYYFGNLKKKYLLFWELKKNLQLPF